MLRSGTVNTIRELAIQGKPVRAIARELGVARNTVRRYVRGVPEARPRLRRASKLEVYKEQIRRWVRADHLLNCETMLPRLQAQGYTGRISILKDFVRPLRPPAAAARRPVIRYETKPGEQLQFDIRNFRVSCPVGRQSARLGLQASGASESRRGGVARGRPYDLDACGRLADRDERAYGALQCTRRSLVSAALPTPQASRWRWSATRGRGLWEPLGASGLRAARLIRPALVALELLSLHLPRTRARMLVRADPSKSLLPGRGRRPLCSSWEQILAQSLEDVRSAFMSV
jgi:hypothetical protein